MIKKYLTLLLGLFFAAVTAQQAQAVPLTGNITFTGGAVLDNDDINFATGVTSWVSPEVFSRSGSFTALVSGGDAVTITPWSFTSGTINSFWTVGGVTFNLLSSVIVYQGNDFLSVSGTGTISAPGSGYDDTEGIWNFSSQGPGADSEFSFSAASKTVKPVPDDGSAVALLGIACLGLEFIRRKFGLRA